jgi:Protein of unknown function (DUF2848)
MASAAKPSEVGEWRRNRRPGTRPATTILANCRQLSEEAAHMRKTLEIDFVGRNAASRRAIALGPAIVAGWTGRDKASLHKHIEELEALGVRRPSSTPVFYRVSAERLTTGKAIEVVGEDTSGEVEFVLLQADGRLWVGVGSDHTDRKVEAYDVAISKQVCEKPIAATFWAFDDVVPHWDSLKLKSFISEQGAGPLYQECAVTNMLPPLSLIEAFCGAAALPDGTVMFCGTSAAIGGIRTSGLFECELEDPVLGRKISHCYSIAALPLVS